MNMDIYTLFSVFTLNNIPGRYQCQLLYGNGGSKSSLTLQE